MKAYENKEELKAEIKRAYDKYIAEFEDIPESLKDKRCMEVDRTPAENLAYQVGWTTLVLKWENDEQAGLPVKTPSDGFKWNQLGELYQWFTNTYANLSLKELMGMLDDNIQKIFTMIDSMTEEELKAEIKRAYDKYIAEFEDIPESLKDKRCMEVDRTPAENLAYQVGWTTLVLKWENDEQAGLPVKTPSDGFKWNQLGELYQWFTNTYANLSLKELMGMLDDNIQKIFTMIDSMTEEELFLPHKRKWADEATKTAVWEVYKFIHVNTVAPFGTFRTKIRKWKKLLL